MQKMVFFIAVAILALGLLGVKGATGYAVAEVSMGNFGISMIGLILFAFVVALFAYEVGRPASATAKINVWNELAEAEEEWQRKRRK